MSPAITMTEAITALVTEKRATGYKYHSEERVLTRFAAFAAARFPGQQAPTRASVEAWIAAARRRGVAPATLHGLAAPVRELARWLGRRGVAAYVRPPGHCPAPPATSRTSTPTRNWRLCSPRPTAAATTRRSRSAHLVMPVLFRTIYACGLRASEARLLRFDDIDLDAGVLTIREGKGGKDRQVPVSAGLRDRLADYHSSVAGRTGGDWLFPGTAGHPLTIGNIDKNFRRFLWQARIPHGGRGHGPRVHDLRHTMAVNNLRSWFACGEDVAALLPVLQAYMGHASIADTDYYLRLTAESYPHITTCIQRAYGDVVPPATEGPCDGN
ncbi:tyrosine-type recombinase/integrase [Saccharopolyspora pogona]|uniref:tyrosine-type recombinase/integrase n=1 Tax=Saccharopolyspora pogona TaxID=333966 RepID=UPI001688C24A|nr:tyrosine-type recombinase/integrase [Saccharopolyspora pogona]